MKNKFLMALLFITCIVALICAPVLSAFAAGGVEVTVDDTGKSNIPGAVVTYNLTLKNTNPGDVEIRISASSASGWGDPVISAASFTLTASSTRQVSVRVPIPVETTAGMSDVTTVIVETDTGEYLHKFELITTVEDPGSSGSVPVVSISSYSTGGAAVTAGSEFGLEMSLKNSGKERATNLVITFNGENFFPLESGGVQTIGKIDPGSHNTVVQKFIAGNDLAWVTVGSIAVSVAYTDPAGNPYSSDFIISIRINEPVIYNGATATPNIPARPQLVVTGYQMDVDPLQPGAVFNLKLDVKNQGMADASSVTVVFGGGAVAESGETQQSGGLSGSEGDFTNFAPLGSSNIIFAGDVAKQAMVNVNQKFVVNVTTEPGAYPFKISFIYDDVKGNRIVDNQVITLLVYNLPRVEISFYRDAGIFMAGTENILPLQVTNLGKTTSVLGNMKVTAEGAEVMNNIALVGALDSGGYFTLDSILIPAEEGALDILISINYTDDFNQPRVFEQVIPIQVLPTDSLPPELNGNGEIPPGEVIEEPTVETFWDKVARFFKGLFGLGSGVEKPVEQPIPSDIDPGQNSPAGPAGPKG